MTELLDIIVGQIVGNISTVLVGVLLYYNFLLFEDYFRLIVWAFLLSQALRGAKENVISILENLSNSSETKERLFNTIYEKSRMRMINRRPHRRRTIKMFFLDNGIFIFALVGAISVLVRMFSWIRVIHLSISTIFILSGFIWITDRRIFYYRYFISDEVLVTIVLIIGMFATGAFVVLYLGTESVIEGSKAARDITEWVQATVINDERTRRIWTEQVTNARSMITSALQEVEVNYNETMWWPPLKGLVMSYYMEGTVDMNASSNISIVPQGLHRNMTVLQALLFAKDSFQTFNFTRVQLTDWTSTGFELSSIAFGSLANLIIFVITFLMAFIGMGIRSVFFITSLYYLLVTQVDPVERFVDHLLPVEQEKKPAVLRSLRRAIEGVFFLPVKISSLHAIVTLISFSLLESDFVFLATFFTFIISIVPIIPPYFVCVPWALTMCFTTSIISGGALFVIHYFAFSIIDDALYHKSLNAINSYVSALSVVFGVYVFGLEGVVFGPLLICGVNFAYEVSGHSIQAARDDLSTSPSSSPTNESNEDTERKILNNPTKEDSTNIFSNAYRAISGDGSFRAHLRNGIRRLSFDSEYSGTVCITLVVGELEERRVRFIASKAWSYSQFVETIQRSLQLGDIEGLYSNDGLEIISVLHIFENETIHIRLKENMNRNKALNNIGSPAGKRLRRRSGRPYFNQCINIPSYRTQVSSRLKSDKYQGEIRKRRGKIRWRDSNKLENSIYTISNPSIHSNSYSSSIVAMEDENVSDDLLLHGHLRVSDASISEGSGRARSISSSTGFIDSPEQSLQFPFSGQLTRSSSDSYLEKYSPSKASKFSFTLKGTHTEPEVFSDEQDTSSIMEQDKEEKKESIKEMNELVHDQIDKEMEDKEKNKDKTMDMDMDMNVDKNIETKRPIDSIPIKESEEIEKQVELSLQNTNPKEKDEKFEIKDTNSSLIKQEIQERKNTINLKGQKGKDGKDGLSVWRKLLRIKKDEDDE